MPCVAIQKMQIYNVLLRKKARHKGNFQLKIPQTHDVIVCRVKH